MLAMFAQDLRYAVRGMLRQPVFTLVVLATLALGIGANTAIFSVVNGILLRPLPYPDADRIMHMVHEAPYSSVSEGEFVDYKRDLRTLDKVAAFTSGEVSLTSGDEPTRIRFTRVSADFFDILAPKPALGRLFSADEYVPRGPRVIILSHAIWKSRFGADSSLVGKEIAIGANKATVVGVLPEHFDYPDASNALWSPMRLNPDSLWGRNNHYMQMIGRLAPNVSRSAALAEMRGLAATWRQTFPETYGETTMVPTMESLEDSITGGARPFLIALLGAVGFVLLIACVNVANLFLARGESRRKEVAIRSALGASHTRLSAQLITESLLFAIVGGALGILVAIAAQGALLAAAPASTPRIGEIRLDAPVFIFNALLVVATGVLFGLYPAVRIARGQPVNTLREGGKTSSTGGGLRARRVMVVAEVAMAVMMLAGAGIMLRSLWKLQSTELGFDPSNTLTAQVSLPSQYDGARAVAFYRDAIARLAALPGVTSAAAIRDLPISSGGSRWSIMINNVTLRSIGESPSAAPQQLTPDALRALSIPIVEGRGFTEADREGAPLVALVNEELARQLWKNESPIGRTIKMFNDASPWATIVGVVKDTRAEGLLEPVPPTMYFPHSQASLSNYSAATTMSFVVKTTGKPETLAPSLRSIVRSLDPTLPVTQVRSMDDVIASSISERQFSTVLLALFAALALLLAGIGIYGVIAFSVSQRMYEIGVRVALGAQRSSVVGLVLKQSLMMTAIGIGIGLVGAVVVTRAARSMLIGVTSYDPLTMVAAVGAIGAVAVLASVIPARRALRVDPITVLRGD
jgi:putative ABC transport system permease protein